MGAFILYPSILYLLHALSQSSEIIISPQNSKILLKFHFKRKSIITIISIHMFITTCFKLVVNREEKNQILKLMRNFSSAVRFSYKRLLEGFTPSQSYTITRQKFPELNSHYVNCAVEKAREIFQSCKARGQNPKKLIFGGRTLFEKLKKNHLQGKRLKELKRKWKEKSMAL